MWHALGALCLREGAGPGLRGGEVEGFEGGVCLGQGREDCWLPWEGPWGRRRRRRRLPAQSGPATGAPYSMNY